MRMLKLLNVLGSVFKQHVILKTKTRLQARHEGRLRLARRRLSRSQGSRGLICEVADVLRVTAKGVRRA